MVLMRESHVVSSSTNCAWTICRVKSMKSGGESSALVMSWSTPSQSAGDKQE